MVWTDQGFEQSEAQQQQLLVARRAELLEILQGSLTLEIDRRSFFDPNTRTVKLMFDGVELSSVSFDVTQRPEYEG